MTTLKIGDRVLMTGGYSGWRGKTGIVVTEEYTTKSMYDPSVSHGPYVLVHFDGEKRPEKGFGWTPPMFDRLFGVGDTVKVIKAYDDEEASLGRIGVIETHDGSEEGFWPYKVRYASDGDFDFYNGADLERYVASVPVAVDEIDDEQGLDEFVAGFILVDEDNVFLSAFETIEDAREEAEEAAEATERSVYVYRMVYAVEVTAAPVETQRIRVR